jgi:hypothetical protein
MWNHKAGNVGSVGSDWSVMWAMWDQKVGNVGIWDQMVGNVGNLGSNVG